ncbi:MAG: stage IV sporulation protein A [Clostridia bacterium]|nr:stage IV sporulation protein A [Clostridia bacterium]
MAERSIYHDIAVRTGGQIYLGVVGPVRTGKSTFIKRFMETLVIPSIIQESDRIRARDELPQSAGGKTVMTTEPKFIPDEAAEVQLQDAEGSITSMKVRMIDCVGYIIPGAIGNYENDAPRMVQTPWSDAPIPFDQAAEIGTRKVICEHSTIGILVCTDGTIGDLPRDAYIDAEKQIVEELKAHGKPFVIVLNSAHPDAPAAQALGLQMEKEYGAPVALVSCAEMDNEDIRHILALALEEFPIRSIGIHCPTWVSTLPAGHRIKEALRQTVMDLAEEVHKIGEVAAVFSRASERNEYIAAMSLSSSEPGQGHSTLSLTFPEDLFYNILGEETGCSIQSDAELFELLSSLIETKKKYERIEGALMSVHDHGYGIVMPDVTELKLEEPEIVRQNGSYGIRLKASAPSIHMIRANIEAEVAPIVGTEQQSEEMVRFLLHEFEEDPTKLWSTNMLGKSLHELVSDGLNSKLSHMPEDARHKIGETIERIINEGAGGLICILL